jgi:Ca2+-binding EF-hand superfamily protein
MGIQNDGWEAISAARQGNLQRAISSSQTKAAPSVKLTQEVRKVFEKFFAEQGGSIRPDQLRSILRRLASKWSDEEIDAIAKGEGWTNGHNITCEEFFSFIFGSSENTGKPRPKLASILDRKSEERGWGTIIDDIYEGRSTLEDALVRASFEAQLKDLLRLHPYLEPDGCLQPHPVQQWVERCRESYEKGKFGQAQEHLKRAVAGIAMDKRQIAEAFRRFDADSSGHLDKAECRHMCAYLGWGHEEADLLDLDRDGRITLGDFQTFVGRMGGVQRLFEHRRLRISDTRKDVCDQSGLVIGARVRSHFYCHRQKSRSWREAVVLAVRVENKS